MRMAAAALGSLVIGLGVPSALLAQNICDEYAGLTKQLGDQNGEVLIVRGFAGRSGAGYMLELFADQQTGTWTALAHYPGEQACILDAGELWHQVPAPPEGDAM